MHIPYGVSYDPNTNRLFVSETGNERVLVFNVSPTTIANGMNAAYVVGQSAFTTNTLATTQSGFWLPGDVLYDNNTTYLFVTDQNNNRVMILDGTYLPYWPPGYE
jgi:DNA-binding beta-propeller fold protein YncE